MKDNINEDIWHHLFLLIEIKIFGRFSLNTITITQKEHWQFSGHWVNLILLKFIHKGGYY